MPSLWGRGVRGGAKVHRRPRGVGESSGGGGTQSVNIQLVPVAEGTSSRRFRAQSLPLPPMVTAADLTSAVVTIDGVEKRIYIADTNARHVSAGNTAKVQAVTLEVETAVSSDSAATTAVLTFGGTPTLARLIPLGYVPHTNTLDVGLSADGKYPRLNSALRIQHGNESHPRTLPAGDGTFYDVGLSETAPASGYKAVTFMLTVDTDSNSFKARWVRTHEVTNIADVNHDNVWGLDTNAFNSSGAVASGAYAGGYGQDVQVIGVWVVFIPPGVGTVAFGSNALNTGGIVADTTGGTHEPLSLMFDQLPEGLISLANASDLCASGMAFYYQYTAAENTAAGGTRADWESKRAEGSFYNWRAGGVASWRWGGAYYFMGAVEYGRHLANASPRELVKALAYARSGFEYGSTARYEGGLGTHNTPEQFHDLSTTAFWWEQSGDSDALQRTKENITRPAYDLWSTASRGDQEGTDQTLRVHMHWFGVMKFVLRYQIDVGTVPAITSSSLADTIDPSLRTPATAIDAYRTQVAILRAKQQSIAATYPSDAGLITMGAYAYGGPIPLAFGPFMAGDLLSQIGFCERIIEAHYGGATANAQALILDCMTFVTERVGIPTADPLMIDDYMGPTEQFYYTRAAGVIGPAASNEPDATNLNGCWGGAFAYAMRVDGAAKWQTLYDRFLTSMVTYGAFWYQNQSKSYSHTCFSVGAYFEAIG